MRKVDPELQERRRTEILAAAERCFAARGFHATSMDAVAVEAGVSPGLVYRYFENKEALVREVAARDRAAAVASLADLEHAVDFIERFVLLVRDELSVVLDEARARLSSEVLAEALRNAALAAHLVAEEEAVRQQLVQVITAQQSAGRVRADLDPGALADVLAALVDGLPIRALITARFDRPASLATIDRMLRAALEP